MSGYRQNSEDDLRVVREQEGIPELEEEEEEAEENGVEEEKKVVVVEENVVSGGGAKEESDSVEIVKVVDGGGCLGQGEHKGLTVIDMPEKGRELLEALKDIEDHFIRAYDSGKDVSRMLEANRVHLQSGLEEIKGEIRVFRVGRFYCHITISLNQILLQPPSNYFVSY